MKPLDHPYRIVQRQPWRPDSPWRLLKPQGAGRPYTPVLTHPDGSEAMFLSYRDAINWLVDGGFISLGSLEASHA